MSTSQLERWFDELLGLMQQRTVFINQGDDPVYFLVYPPRWSLNVYELLPTWQSKLKHRGYTPRVFNLGVALTDYIANHSDHDLFVEYELNHPDDPKTVRDSIADLLVGTDGQHLAEKWIISELEQAAISPQGMLIITGVELLHPYLQIGRIEQRLQGKFVVPTVVCYPGTRTSTFGLSYLGVYPPDGNYRSRHVGGTSA